MSNLQEVYKTLSEGKGLKTGELEQFRNEDIGQVMVDVVKRDQEEGKYNINIIIYQRPDLPRHKVEPAIKVACIHLFNNDKTLVDTFYRDEALISKDIGASLQMTNSWCVEIMWPRSIMFSDLVATRNMFMDSLSKALGK